MSAHSNQEFEQLLIAFANRDLEVDQRTQLDTLASGDSRRQELIADLAHVHRALDAEQALRQACLAPTQAREEGDPCFQRLNAVAAQAEQGLRTIAGGSGMRTAVGVPRSGGRVWRWAAAAALALVAWLGYTLGWRTSAPPEDYRLDQVQRILLSPTLAEAMPQVSWHVVVGARTYDAVINDAAGQVVLVRPTIASASTTWQLSPGEYRDLARRETGLFLRVVARDGAGLPVATSGDLELQFESR